ncbi:hypothetical protein KOI35_08600 [Actinoplanes bogorensis]|uniref:Uncharacterized protein n=1 Tax=Paractinoplanes bogorensis TaxID=1610840 RepID=A0ABS5YJI0_9ACTN|nr:hypothetical protein [Actinoplanes bogorensis]MBU2663563.1 hypothetical protein [Actinoplanes bogorensis]
MNESGWPDAIDLLHLLAESTGHDSGVRDAGILVAVATRPHVEMLGTVVYATPLKRSAALLHGTVAWRPLHLWNSGLGWGATFMTLARQGFDLDITPWQQMTITDEIMQGELDDIDAVADRLAPFLRIR